MHSFLFASLSKLNPFSLQLRWVGQLYFSALASFTSMRPVRQSISTPTTIYPEVRGYKPGSTALVTHSRLLVHMIAIRLDIDLLPIPGCGLLDLNPLTKSGSKQQASTMECNDVLDNGIRAALHELTKV
jgi:hypothetical protein